MLQQVNSVNEHNYSVNERFLNKKAVQSHFVY